MGNPFVEELNRLNFQFPGMDCGQCQVKSPLVRDEIPRPFKCCSFQPFWSSFMVAGMIAENGEGQFCDLIGPDTVLLPIGAVPSPHKRRLQQEMDMVSRLQSRELVCDFYNFASGRCRGFAFRPMTCRQYFCASGDKRKSQIIQQVHSDFEELQAQYLQEFVRGNGYNSEDWEKWIDYLEPDGFNLEPHKEFAQREDAMDYYRLAGAWLQEKLAQVEWPPQFVLKAIYELNQ